MTALIVIATVLLVFALILSLRIKLRVKLDGSDFSLAVTVGGIKVFSFPKKEKKRKKPRLSAFSYEKHKKRLEKERLKAEKKAAKKAKKKSKSDKIKDKAAETAGKAKKSLGEKVTSVVDFVKFVLGEFPRLASYIRTEIKAAHITVGTGDAAKTAELYGGISAALSLLIELLDKRTRLRKIKQGAVSVSPDFLGEKTDARLDISLKITLFSVLRVGCHTLAWFIRKKVGEAAKQVRK